VTEGSEASRKELQAFSFSSSPLSSPPQQGGLEATHGPPKVVLLVPPAWSWPATLLLLLQTASACLAGSSGLMVLLDAVSSHPSFSSVASWVSAMPRVSGLGFLPAKLRHKTVGVFSSPAEVRTLHPFPKKRQTAGYKKIKREIMLNLVKIRMDQARKIGLMFDRFGQFLEGKNIKFSAVRILFGRRFFFSS
jgi:hypothetical protein